MTKMKYISIWMVGCMLLSLGAKAQQVVKPGIRFWISAQIISGVKLIDAMLKLLQIGRASCRERV